MAVITSAPTTLDLMNVAVIQVSDLRLIGSLAMVIVIKIDADPCKSLTSILDIDECSEESDRCTDNCRNTAGSYTCSCNTGYQLNSNGYSCDGIYIND